MGLKVTNIGQYEKLVFVDWGRPLPSGRTGGGRRFRGSLLQQQLSQYHIAQQDEDRRRDHRLGGGATHIDGTALDRVATIAGDGGNEEGKAPPLLDAVIDMVGVEERLQSVDESVGRRFTRNPSDNAGADEARGNTQDDQDRHEDDQRHNLGQDDVVGRIDTHNLHSINLFRDAHGANFGGDVRPYLTRQNQTHDGRREFEHHDLARGVADDVTGQDGIAHVEHNLQDTDGADEDRDEADNADGVEHQFVRLVDELASEHRPVVGLRQHAPHQQDVASQGL